MYLNRLISCETTSLINKHLATCSSRCIRHYFHSSARSPQYEGSQPEDDIIDHLSLSRRIQNRLYGDVEPVIGLEVHAQLKLNSKLFSHGGTRSNTPPNNQLDLFDISLPGTLPTVNKRAVEYALITGMALNCNIQSKFNFDRKNYFYADMPAGFQITQLSHPIVESGYIDFIVTSYHNSLIAHSQQYDMVKYLFSQSRLAQEEIQPYIKRSNIKQIQLEQDSAKTLQEVPMSMLDIGHQSKEDATACTLIDYNRSGASLIEIVFEPDLTNHHEASSLVKELVRVLKVLDTCDCELQEGSLRVDANVSIKRIGGSEIHGSKKVELKNLNSLRALNRGIQEEIYRQSKVIKAGGTVEQESRTYDSRSKETKFLRRKETAIDYRYIPEPSIPPIVIDERSIERLRAQSSDIQLPATIREKCIKEYNMELSLVNEVLDEPGLIEYIDEILCKNPEGLKYDPETVVDFLVYTIHNLRNLKTASLPLGDIDLRDETGEFRQRLAIKTVQDLLDMMIASEISYSTAYEVIKCIYVNNEKSSPREVVEHLGWFQINDMDEIDKLCTELLKTQKNAAKKYAREDGKGKKYLRHLLDKLCQETNNRISVEKSIQCLDSKLRSHDLKAADGVS